MKNVNGKQILSLLTATLAFGCNAPAGKTVSSALTASSQATPEVTPAVASVSAAVTSVVASTVNWIYATSRADNKVYAFGIDPTTGALSQVTQSDGANVSIVITGNNPIGVALSASGNFLYTLNVSDLTISKFTVQANGGLVALSGTVSTGASPVSISFGTDGKLYVPLNDGHPDCYQFPVNATSGVVSMGSLSTNTVATTNHATLVQPTQVTVGNYTYVINTSLNVIEQYANSNMSVVLQQFNAGNHISSIVAK